MDEVTEVVTTAASSGNEVFAGLITLVLVLIVGGLVFQHIRSNKLGGKKPDATGGKSRDNRRSLD